MNDAQASARIRLQRISFKAFIAINIEEKEMKVTVRFTAQLSEITKINQTIVDLDDGSHLSDLFQVLASKYGKTLIESTRISEMGAIDSWFSVVVDGKAMSAIPQSNIPLKEGSVIVLLAAVGGG